jgi:hypothetical protein
MRVRIRDPESIGPWIQDLRYEMQKFGSGINITDPLNSSVFISEGQPTDDATEGHGEGRGSALQGDVVADRPH